jgi:F0F1-type ATP synthase assembly protein I
LKGCVVIILEGCVVIILKGWVVIILEGWVIHRGYNTSPLAIVVLALLLLALAYLE